jgi:hypothetical protein
MVSSTISTMLVCLIVLGTLKKVGEEYSRSQCGNVGSLPVASPVVLGSSVMLICSMTYMCTVYVSHAYS